LRLEIVLNDRTLHTTIKEHAVSLKFRTDELSPAEASLIAWQFGFHEDDDPFYLALWQTISRAWASDHSAPSDLRPKTYHLKRLGAAGAYPEEVAVYTKFKSAEGEKYWLSLLKRAGLDDRRKTSIKPPVERRRRAVVVS
jgi:hypothetical protein